MCSSVRFPLLFLLLVASLVPTADAGNWTTRWGLGAGLGYTDNVSLAPSGEEESDLLLNFTPSVQMRGVSGRSSTNLVARANSFLSLTGSGNSSINPSFQFGNSLEVLKQRFFVDTSASIQRAFSLRDDNVSSTGFANTGFNVGDISISPYWQEHLGSFADVTARYTYRMFYSGRDTVSNTDSHGVDVRAQSGRWAPRLSWSGFYRTTISDGGNGFDTGNASLNVAYNWIYDLSLNASFGYFNSNVDQGNIPGANNGSLARAGLSWSPSSLTSLGFLAGPGNWVANARWGMSNKLRFFGRYGRNQREDFSDVTGGRPFWDVGTSWNPSPRTRVNVSYYRPEFGVNSESASWNGEIAFDRKRTQLKIRATQDTTTTQQLIQQSNGFVLDPATGAPLVDDNGNLLLQASPVVSNTDEFFISRCLEATITRRSRKNSFDLKAGIEKREFDLAADDERRYGGRFLWTYTMNPRTTFNTQLGYLNTLFSDTDEEDQQWSLRIGLRKQLGRRVAVSLEYARNQKQSDDAAREFTENAALLNFSFGSTSGGGSGFGASGRGIGSGFQSTATFGCTGGVRGGAGGGGVTGTGF